MARKVFFHIGAPKTGTTYLQLVMAQNREVLQKQGIVYADGRYAADRVHASELARGHDYSRDARAAGAWQRIVDQVEGANEDAVISHEFFGACDEGQARSVISDLAPAEVHLIFTARDYSRQATAVWQERLKYGRGVPLSKFTLDENNGTPVWSWRTQDAVAILARWSVGLAPEHVHVVTVPPPTTAGNLLWTRFASVLGIDTESCDTNVAFANSSLGVVEAELLRRFDERLPEKFKDRRKAAAWVRNVLANEVLASRDGEPLTLSTERFSELAQASHGAATAIRAAGYDVVGDVNDLIPAPVRPGRAPEEVPDSELLDAALDAIGGLLSSMETKAQQRKKRVTQNKPPSLVRRALARARRDR